MIRDIDLSKLKQKQYISGNKDNYLFGFSNVNIFIGGNNSGKSIFMRSLIESLPDFIVLNNNVVKSLKQKGPELIRLLDILYNKTRDDIFNYIDTNLNEVISENNKVAPLYFLTKLKTYGSDITKYSPSYVLTPYVTRYIADVNNIVDQIFKSSYAEHKSKVFNHFYIPVLRGLKPLLKFEDEYIYNHIYSERITHDYPNIKSVFTGLEVFEEVKKRLLGEEKDRIIIKDFEDYISNNLFKQQITLIPKYGDDILNIKIGNDPQRSIVDLGDGLQSLICILFPIFMEKDKEFYFFIEEPELNLHPSLQKKLINLLSEPIFNLHQYFITTHSAHIIDHKNASIYNFVKENDKTKITHLDNKNKIVHSLNLLGYTPSDLLQTNFIIWVEGQTDKMLLNSLISKNYPNLIENTHYSIMFYGGSGDKYLLEDANKFEFIMSLNRNCAVIKDSDKTDYKTDISKKQGTFDALEAEGVITWLTSKREIENHILVEDFLKALRSQQKNSNIEMLEPTPYGDYYKVKINNKVSGSYSPKRQIYLSEELFKEIGIRKGNLTRSNSDFIKEELKKSIIETKNTKQIREKVAVVEKLIEIGFNVDDEFSEFIKKLCAKIKEVNHIK